MSHPCIVVIGYGFNIDKFEITYDTKTYTNLNEYLDFLRNKFPSLGVHYNDYNCLSVFITVAKKEIYSDVGRYCDYQEIDVEKLRPNEDEFLLLCEARKHLIGEKKVRLSLAMYTYENVYYEEYEDEDEDETV